MMPFTYLHGSDQNLQYTCAPAVQSGWYHYTQLDAYLTQSSPVSTNAGMAGPERYILMPDCTWHAQAGEQLPRQL